MLKQTQHNPLLKAVTILTDIIEDVVEYDDGIDKNFVKQRLDWAKKYTVEYIKSQGVFKPFIKDESKGKD